MELLFTSFLAGILTVLSPCVLPLLPIVIGGSLTDNKKSRAFIIILSLGLSIIIFTLLLKTSFSFFTIPNIDFPIVNTSVPLTQVVSGLIILIFGIFTLFPQIYEWISAKLKFSNTSQGFLSKAATRRGVVGNILVGVALGPVFASCSLTYAIILATVLPASFINGLIDLIAYVVGISLLMFLIAIFGQKLIGKLRWAANPTGKFRKILGVIFIVVALVITVGLDKRIQTFFAEHGYVDGTQLEKGLLNIDSSKMFNIDKPYPAPDFVGINSWINSQPLKIADLKGKVVVIDVWTYSCINCIRTLPYVTGWYEKYKSEGLVIVGLHAPEFNFEKEKSNVEKATKDYNINYPVALDNDKKTWTAYGNNAWPTTYFIDKDGNIRHKHVGEGDYSQNEDIIRTLLKEKRNYNIDNISKTSQDNSAPVTQQQSPETYLGYAKNAQYRFINFLNNSDEAHDTPHDYTIKDTTVSNSWSIGGNWTVNEDEIIPNGDNNILRFNFNAKDVYLVMGADTEKNITVKVDGKIANQQNFGGENVDSNGIVKVKDFKLYKLVHSDQFLQNKTIELSIPKGVKVNVFTFGS